MRTMTAEAIKSFIAALPKIRERQTQIVANIHATNEILMRAARRDEIVRPAERSVEARDKEPTR